MTGRIAFLLICMTILGTIKGCTKPVEAMSPEDLETCDATAAMILANATFPVPANGINAFPFWATPGEANITAPLNGAIFPYGAPVDITFTQAVPDPNVAERIIKVFLTPFDTVKLTELPVSFFDLFGKVPANYQNLGTILNPVSSGKFIILVMSWNLRNGGNPKGNPKYDFGPPSMAYACIKIDPVKALGGNTIQGVTMMPLEDVTLPPTGTWTATPWPTLTPTLSPTPIIPTVTSTFTKVPPTDIPTAVVDCRSYSDPDNCKRQEVCKWVPSIVSAPYCTHK